jgi:hypothetical protein
MSPSLESHCRKVARALIQGSVVPLLGAGANLCDRPQGQGWLPGTWLPTGGELAQRLAEEFDYPLADVSDLLRVCQFVEVDCGSGPLYELLHEVFNADYPPTSLHEFLARLPAALEAAGHPRRHQLVVTTNYDDALERAFDAAGEPYDLLSYLAIGQDQGRFLHRDPDGNTQVIQRPNTYDALSLQERSVIVKIHGTVDRQDAAKDSYVITEDDYIEYLTRTTLSDLIPGEVLRKLMRSHLLFLGYRMRDWNLRVILHRIWQERDLGYKAWAVQLDADEIDVAIWDDREVDVYPTPLRDYVDAVQEQIHGIPARAV